MPLHLFAGSVEGCTEALHPIEAEVRLRADLHQVWHDGGHFRLARRLLTTKHFDLLRARPFTTNGSGILNTYGR